MITVHQLVKRFRGGGREVLAVDHLSFTVSPAEVYGLLGPNGAGKTTTVRMIVGLLQPDEGFAEVHGFRTSDAPDEVESRIGLVSAEDGLYPWLTVREMLLFFADLYGVPPQLARERIDPLVELLQLGSFFHRRCATLSSGQRQRVTLARALIHDPPVMLMDEPTRGLDVVGSQVVFEYIAYLREQGKAIIVSTHHLDERSGSAIGSGFSTRGVCATKGLWTNCAQATRRDSLVEMFIGFLKGPVVGRLPTEAERQQDVSRN